MKILAEKLRAPKNRTLSLSELQIIENIKETLSDVSILNTEQNIRDKVIHGNSLELLDHLPSEFSDLVFVDPPYNLSKKYSQSNFKKRNDSEYEEWLELWIPKLYRILKPHGSLYICCDWQSSPFIYNIGKKYFNVNNRITWEREKGRGAQANWKNCIEDIWFFTKSDDYYFNVDAVKIKKKVIAPYKTKNGEPKDWQKTDEGNFRFTHPSNIWTDITIPFWSMPENTDHPTQKSEKLLAKIILASSKPGDMVFDPFLGSGTTAVVAKKLGRHFCGIEKEDLFCALSVERLKRVDQNNTIQGFEDGVFYDRNSGLS